MAVSRVASSSCVDSPGCSTSLGEDAPEGAVPRGSLGCSAEASSGWLTHSAAATNVASKARGRTGLRNSIANCDCFDMQAPGAAFMPPQIGENPRRQPGQVSALWRVDSLRPKRVGQLLFPRLGSPELRRPSRPKRPPPLLSKGLRRSDARRRRFVPPPKERSRRWQRAGRKRVVERRRLPRSVSGGRRGSRRSYDPLVADGSSDRLRTCRTSARRSPRLSSWSKEGMWPSFP